MVHVSSTPREEMQGGDMVIMLAGTCSSLSAPGSSPKLWASSHPLRSLLYEDPQLTDDLGGRLTRSW